MANEDNWNAAAEDFVARQRTGASLNTIQNRDPDAAARAQRIAKYLPVSPALVEAQLPLFTKDANLQHNRETIAQYPWMAGFLGDADAAATVPQGELGKVGNIVDTLGKRPKSAPQHPTLADPRLTQSSYFGKQTATAPRQISGIFDTDIGQPKTVGYEGPRVIPDAQSTGDLRVDLLRGWFSGRLGSMTSAVAGGAGALQNFAGLAADDPRRQRVSDIASAGDFLSTYYRPKSDGGWRGKAGDYAFDAGQMVFDMAVGGGIAGKALAGYFGAETATSAYSKYNERSDKKGQALLGATLEGGAEYLGEKTPLGALLNIFGGKAVKGLVVDYIRKEVIGEVLTTAVQYSADTNLADPTQEFSVKGLGMAMLDTAAVTLLGGAIIGGAAHTMRPAAQAAREAQDAMQAVESHAILESVMADAEKSVMRANAPEQFAQFLQQGAETGTISKVYVPVEAIDKLLADPALPEEERAVLTLYQSAIDEARPGNNEIVIPVGEFASKFTGTLYQKLADEVRTSAGGMSAKEARTFQDEKVAELEKLDTVDTGTEGDVAAAEVQRSSKQQVYDTVKQQMLDAGRPAREAETTALLAASRAETLATTRYGQFPDAMAAHKAVGFTIAPAGKAGKKGAKKGAKRSVNQAEVTPAYDAAAEADSAYAYHVTTLDNLADIQAEGRLSPFNPDYGTEQDMWPDGSVAPRIYLADTPKGTEPFQQERPVLVRTRRTAAVRKERGTPDLYSEEALGGLEYLGSDGKWHAIEGQTEDVFSSTTGDGTGQGTEGAERTAYQGARGKTDWFSDGSTVVTLFAQANFSTMLHEMSHVFLEQEFTLAQSDKASPELKADVESIKAWMAANGHPVGADGVIPIEAHELWARTGEAYFRKGEAPSKELQSAFRQFKRWLEKIYLSIKALEAYGPVALNPDISDIMDRMIATSDAIATHRPQPLSREALDMTPAQYAAYEEAIEAVRAEGETVAHRRRMLEIRLRDRAEGTKWRADARRGLIEEFNAQPANIALHLLRTGNWLNDPLREPQTVKLHVKWLTDNYGPEVLDQLPRSKTGQSIWGGSEHGGVTGDVVAEMTGMPSGNALVTALRGLRAQQDALPGVTLREAYVRQALNDYISLHYGYTPMTNEEIDREAQESLAEAHRDVLFAEWRALKRRQNKGGVMPPAEVFKAWAQARIAASNVGEVLTKDNRPATIRFLRAMTKARNELEKALIKGGQEASDEAVKQKTIEIVNNEMVTETKRAGEEMATTLRRLKRLAKVDAVATIDQDYLDRIHELLAAYGFREPAQFPPETPFAEWAAARTDQGYKILLPDNFEQGRGSHREVTVAKLRELNNMVVNLRHQGRAYQHVMDGEQERLLTEVVAEIEEQILARPERNQGEASFGESNRPFSQAVREAKGVADVGRAILNTLATEGLRSRLTGLATNILRVENFSDIIDGTKFGVGPMNRTLIHPGTDSINLFSRLQEEVIGSVLTALKGTDGKYNARMDDHITLPFFTVKVALHDADPTLGQAWSGPRHQYLGMLANTGSMSNLAKMVGGEKQGDPESMTDMVAFRDNLISFASAEDLRIVNAIWAAVEKLWPHIVRVERNMTGVVPEKVVPLPYMTPQGVEMTGGYWPVVWDSARSKMGQKQVENMDSEQTKLFGLSTDVGHSITRTDDVAPMEYSLHLVLGGHVTKVISRIAYAEYVRDALRILNSSKVKGAINLRFTKKHNEMMVNWLRDQIPSAAVSAQGAKDWDGLINGLRINMSMAVLGLSYSTIYSQSLGLTYSAAMLGEGDPKAGAYWLGVGMKTVIQHMGNADGGVIDHARGAQDFVFARSEEMSRRRHEISQEAAEAYRRLKDKNTAYRRFQAAAFVPMGLMDLHAVSIPTWLGAYAKARHEGLSEPEAARYGDKMVRLSQGSGRNKDMTQLQRGTAGQKFFAMFFTPGAVFFNQQWESYQHVRAGEKAKAAVPLMWMVVFGSLAGALMQGDWPDEGDDGERGIGDWAMWALRNSLFEMLFGLPIVRDIANAGERKLRGEYSEYGSTPLSFFATSLERGGTSAYKIATREDGEPVEGKDVKAIATALGVALRFPGLQVGRTAGFATDVANGTAEPESFYDYYSGVTSGKLPEKEEAQ